MNSVSLMGRLGRDPELRRTSGGTAVANFTLAVDTGFGEKKATSWFQVTAWGKTGEFIDQYFKKGAKIALTGRLEEQTWEKDGQKKSKVIVVAERAYFTDSKSAREPGSDDFDAPEQAKEEEF